PGERSSILAYATVHMGGGRWSGYHPHNRPNGDIATDPGRWKQNTNVVDPKRVYPSPGLPAADGARAADSPSPNSSGEGKVISDSSSEAPTTPPPPPVCKVDPQPNLLPRHDFKVVLRPQNVLKLSNLKMAEISLDMLNYINFTWLQANLKVLLDAMQNTATISTPSSDAAKVLCNVKQLKIGHAIRTVILYGLAPNHSSKGFIRKVPLSFSDAAIPANLDQSQFETYTCRGLGQFKPIILTFPGLKAPYFVTLFRVERFHNQTSLRATNAASETLKQGQPANLCAQSAAATTLRQLRDCPKRLREPCVLRRRKLAGRQAKERETRRDRTPQCGRPKDRSRTRPGGGAVVLAPACVSLRQGTGCRLLAKSRLLKDKPTMDERPQPQHYRPLEKRGLREECMRQP
ncbi:hypothetical protein HPB47_021809, partial [Ixodes persulcatus]